MLAPAACTDLPYLGIVLLWLKCIRLALPPTTLVLVTPIVTPDLFVSWNLAQVTVVVCKVNGENPEAHQIPRFMSPNCERI